MKKLLTLLFILLTLTISVSAQSFEVGISAGKDFYTIPDLSTGFNLQDLTEATLERTGFENPIAFGISLGYNSNENYSIIFEGDFNYLEYNVDYTRNVPKLTDPFYKKTSNYNVPWARLGAMISFNYIPYSIEKLDFVIGGGLGLQIFAPAVSDKFIAKTLFNKISELDLSTDIDLNFSFSQKINAGVKYNFNSNINLGLISSYTIVNNAIDEAPDNFLTLKLQLGYLF